MFDSSIVPGPGRYYLLEGAGNNTKANKTALVLKGVHCLAEQRRIKQSNYVPVRKTESVMHSNEKRELQP